LIPDLESAAAIPAETLFLPTPISVAVTKNPCNRLVMISLFK